MNVPDNFPEVHAGDNLIDLLKHIGYSGEAHYVAFWWEPVGDELAYADSDGNAAGGLLENWTWLQDVLLAIDVPCDLGGSEDLGPDVLIWDRLAGRVFVAPRGEGLAFLGQ